MENKKYTWLFYLIATTVVATIGVQFYWNFKNYEENKQRVSNEIQLSLDNAVEIYYATLAKKDFLTILKPGEDKIDIKFSTEGSFDSVIKSIRKEQKKGIKPKFTINNIKITSDENLSQQQLDSMMNDMKEFATEVNNDKLPNKKNKADTSLLFTQFTDQKNGFSVDKNGKKTKIQYFKGKKSADSLKLIKNLKPMFISFFDNSLNYKKLDSLIETQLHQKGIDIKTSFHHIKNDTLFHQTKDSVLNAKTFIATSKSTYVKEDQRFELLYNNPNLEALQRSFGGIAISLILSLLIISCLFYLLKIIKQQKALANIKNDLISNITHEFKTPIATVATALEAIENFNVIDDKEKTQKYVNLSAVQLKKLHQMVEKLLETATLDSEQLLLKKETINVVEMTEKIVNKHRLLANSKELIFSANVTPIYCTIDAFHIENVISNIIDNAIKYGGNTVEVNINSILNVTEFTIADNGNGIEKQQQEKIFDKFYRVPKGNTHDVKGFGIGLYYCKKIIEKHNGSIDLKSTKKQTIFKITMPNE
jgi:two-component system phosphate regulon sensor histidine kinase PhoR